MAPNWFELSHADVVSGVPSDATGVVYDSRKAMPGCVFVAIRGANFDGHLFIADAVERGAAQVVVEHGASFDAPPSVKSLVAVPDTRVALAEAAAAFYGHPARVLGTIGVTGTDGKTTTTHLIAHVLNATGYPTGYLSSVEFGLPQSAELNASHMTTLEAPDVQRHLAAIRDAGGRYAVIEASSHGLAMHRVDQCEFDVGVFTNLSPDHLDYHGTMEKYRDAKAELFRMLGRSVDKGFAKAAVLNADDRASAHMESITNARIIRYGLRSNADIRASGVTSGAQGTSFRVWYTEEKVEASTPLLGDYNVSNCLAAIGVALSQGVPLADAAAALASFPGVPGRMEMIDEGQPFRVIVDIASTEQAMRNVLHVLRPATKGKLIVVFGAAGERDRARRSGLAHAVVLEGAHCAIMTNEDPRSEDPEDILTDIEGPLRDFASGSPHGRLKSWRIPDRRAALSKAFDLAVPGDIVLLAGKGTEQSIVIGTTHYPWDERVVARELLRERGFGV